MTLTRSTKQATLARQAALALLAVLLLASAGCKAREVALAPAPGKRPPSAKAAQQYVGARNLPFRHLELKGTFRADVNDRSLKGRYVIRISQDQGVWGSLQVLGFEVARFLWQGDTLQLLNRWENTHLLANAQSLRAKVGAQLTQHQLQQLLVGNLPEDVRYGLISEPNEPTAYWLENRQLGVALRYQGAHTRPTQCHWGGQPPKAVLTYGAYQPLPLHTPDTAANAPYRLDFVAAGANLALSLDHKSVEVLGTAPDMPFKVPDGFATQTL